MKTSLKTSTAELLDGLVSLFYPYHCVMCRTELSKQDEYFCFACREELHYTYFEKYEDYTFADQVFWGRINIENVYSMLYFEKGNTTQNILHKIKYNEGREIGAYMGELMGEKMKGNEIFSQIDGIVPVPLHSKKEFKRGYNQSLAIAEGLSKSLGAPIVDILYRVSHDESQTRKSKEERHENVKGKFALKPGVSVDNQHYLIVDDVLTTGSTLEFVTRAVLNSSDAVKVSLATLAIAYH